MRMNRRESLMALCGFSAVAASGVTLSAAPKKYGCITVASHTAHQRLTGENLRVYVDGVEVNSCYEADDVKGYAKVFCRDEQDHEDWTAKGHLHAKTDHCVCEFYLTGDVVIAPGKVR